uniref:Uncharacterized protein n=1 Tax=Meloidogyne enterolobii TaxID=390850 RepID=A0A6V7U2F1_MELEN|nr:unnamed protein product [Meloidogyne enterolobii]CAD2197734.1 unnamed protein product [Meloidogyne enterolobii]
MKKNFLKLKQNFFLIEEALKSHIFSLNTQFYDKRAYLLFSRTNAQLKEMFEIM